MCAAVIAQNNKTMELIPIQSKRIDPTDNLADVLDAALRRNKQRLHNNDIIAIVSKVVALTEGNWYTRDELETWYGKIDVSSAKHKKVFKRYGAYPSDPALAALIRHEADYLFPGEMYLALNQNILTPSSGIDTSNVTPGSAILWPKNSFTSADKLVRHLRAQHHIKNLGVLIFDSYILPLRTGITGIALGYSGFAGVEDCRGQRDLFGRPLKVTRRDLADGLAAAATLLTGEAGQSIPFVLVRGANTASITFTTKKPNPKEIITPPKHCLYQAMYPRALKTATPR